MDTQLPIDFDKATMRRDEGIETSRAHAESEYPEWGSLALAELRRYCAQPQISTFMVEDVRAFGEKNIPPPPDKRAWGHVILRAHRAGWVQKAGWAQKKSPNQHCAPGNVWAVIRGKL